MKFAEFKISGENFFRGLVSKLAALGISTDALIADHLCFRVASQSEYEFYRRHLERFGELLIESPVNGRPICTFRLHEPFQTERHRIDLLELPAPKPGAAYSTGFEHAEFVVKESFETFIARHPGLPFRRGSKNALNPEISLPLGDRQVKFHHQSLERVIEIENTGFEDLVFDFDGTLIRSREIIEEVNRIVFSEATGREVSRAEVIEKFHPEFAKLLDAFEIREAEARRRAIDAWGLVSERFEYELLPGVDRLLAELATRDHRLHLWTARDESSARKILRDLGIDRHFTTMTFADFESSKPHPRNLRFDWNSSSGILVIGDSATDILGARAIGAVSAGALWDPHSRADALIAAGSDLLFESAEELGDWLRDRFDTACRPDSPSCTRG